MSNEKTTTTVFTELAIVKRIMAKLKLGDAGKLASFFEKQVKGATKSIRDLGRNKTTVENSLEDRLQDLNDKLEDATEAVVDAYDAVTADDVKTNQSRADFTSVYWGNITRAEALVTSIEESIEYAKESTKDQLEDISEQIAKYQTRIDRMSKD